MTVKTGVSRAKSKKTKGGLFVHLPVTVFECDL